MKKYCKALVNIAVAILIVLLILWLLPKLLYFFMPFVVGWVVALIAKPLVEFLEKRVKLKRKIGSAFVIVVVISAVVFLLGFVLTRLGRQAIGLIADLPSIWSSIQADMSESSGKINTLLAKLTGNAGFDLAAILGKVWEYVGGFLARFSQPALELTGSLVMSLPNLFIGAIMALLSAYFFVADRTQINSWLRSHIPAQMQIRYRMVRDSLVKSVGGYFKAQLKIEVWMYLLLVIGFGVLDVSYFMLIALLVAFLDFLPFFGTGTVLIPWTIIELLTADYKMAIGLCIIRAGGQLARNLIQPKMVGDSVGLEPLPTLFMLYIGYKVGGVISMIIAVPIGLLLLTMYKEGTFQTTQNSVLLLMSGINKFRKFEENDLEDVETVRAENAKMTAALEEQRSRVQIQEEEAKKAKKAKKVKKAKK